MLTHLDLMDVDLHDDDNRAGVLIATEEASRKITVTFENPEMSKSEPYLQTHLQYI